MATADEMRRTAIDWTNRGAALAGANQIDEAVDCFRRAVEADPGYVLGHKNLGVCLEVRGDLHGAVSAFQRVFELDHGSVETHRKLGDLHVMLSEMAIAATHYRKAALL